MATQPLPTTTRTHVIATGPTLVIAPRCTSLDELLYTLSIRVSAVLDAESGDAIITFWRKWHAADSDIDRLVLCQDVLRADAPDADGGEA